MTFFMLSTGIETTVPFDCIVATAFYNWILGAEAITSSKCALHLHNVETGLPVD